MNRPGLLPLDSYQLSRYAVQAPCYLCSGGNLVDAQYCRHCEAPMALSHQAAALNIRPRLVAVLGAAASGKTVFLGMLADMLSHGRGPLQLMARGALSVNLAHDAVAALSRCDFPDPTPDEPHRWNWLSGQLRLGRRKAVDVLAPDFSGGALMSEIEKPHTVRLVRSFVEQAEAAVVIVDAARLAEGDRSPDHWAMKMLSYVLEVAKKQTRGRPERLWRKRPVAVVFTKCDQCEAAAADAEAFARRHAPGVWELCRDSFPLGQFFPASVAGAVGLRTAFGRTRVAIPLRVEPRGIIEPIAWLADHLPRKSVRSWQAA